MTSKWAKWAWPIETGILDLAMAVMMIRWIRRRNEAQALNIWQDRTAMPVVDDVLGRAAGAGNLPAGKWRKAGIAVDLIRRIVGSQAFFFLALACFNKDSWLNRELRSFGRMIFNRPELPDAKASVSLRDRLRRW